MRVFSRFQLERDGLTDRRTDGRTDKASYRVACPQLKKDRIKENKAGYTAIEVPCRWAGAVMKVNLSILAGAVMQKPPVNAEKANGD